MATNTNNRLTTDGISHLWQRIKLLVSNSVSGKVDKVSGKGLSSNDYTNAEKTKLSGIATGAQKNVQPDWNASTGDGAILNKPTVPTKVSQLTNDSKFANESEVTTAITEKLSTLNANYHNFDTIQGSDYDSEDYTAIVSVSQTDGKISARQVFINDYIEHRVGKLVDKNYLATQTFVNDKVASAVGKITSFEYKIVDSLPAVSDGKKGVIYLIAHSGSTNQNSYDEYIFLPAEGSTAARYEKIGTTDMDLSSYAKKTEIPTKVSQLSNDSNFVTSSNVSSSVSTAIGKLNKSDSAIAGQYVSAVSETNGIITVSRASVADAIPAIDNDTIDSICTL